MERDAEQVRRQSSADDPILNMAEYLARKGLFNADGTQKISADFTIELDSAIKSAGI
jgi:TPP-dependent pyruvate/acetoin dehydrogenase alpha subunit